MNASILFKPIIALMLIIGLASMPSAATLSKHIWVAPDVAQQQDDPDAEGVTFDSLLRESSYTLYIEARNVGAWLNSTEFHEVFGSALPMLGQFGGGAEFLPMQLVTGNPEMFERSRLMIAFSPADPALPSQMFAVELESEDKAKEVEAKLMERLAPAAAADGQHSDGDENIVNRTKSSLSTIRRAKNLIAFSTTAFTFKSLRGADDKTMNDDPNFRAAHDHFYSDAVFVYYDVALAQRQKRAAEERLQQTDDEGSDAVRQPASAEAQTATVKIGGGEAPSPVQEPASPPAVAASTAAPDEEIDYPRPAKEATVTAVPPATPASRQASAKRRSAQPAPARPPAMPAAQATAMRGEEQPTAPNGTELLGRLFSLLMPNRGMKDPEAFAIAVAMENDALAVRALTVNAPGTAVGPIPFWSLQVCGPAISTEAANYVPANTDVFIAASVDWLRFVELAAQQQREIRYVPDPKATPGQNQTFDTRSLAFEKANHIRMADLLAATLGNEIALSIPLNRVIGGAFGRMPLRAQSASAEPLMLVAVRDRKMFEPKLRAVFDTIGVRLANAKTTTEKVGDIEITSFGNLAYAFINNYLILASSGADIRRAVEARAGNTTLAASHNFQSYTQWQPAATVAQVYVSAEVLKGLFSEITQGQGEEIKDQEIKDFLARYRFEPEPITYAASAEGVGAHYELRIPKHLLMSFFAQMTAREMATRVPRNEMMARMYLQALQEQEKAYKKQHGRYAAMDELPDAHAMQMRISSIGYKLELSASDSDYEATATPVEYGKTGKLSFYTDQSGVVRQGDHGGKSASSSDKPYDPKQEN